jgi:hypothetical protein
LFFPADFKKPAGFSPPGDGWVKPRSARKQIPRPIRFMVDSFQNGRTAATALAVITPIFQVLAIEV